MNQRRDSVDRVACQGMTDPSTEHSFFDVTDVGDPQPSTDLAAASATTNRLKRGSTFNSGQVTCPTIATLEIRDTRNSAVVASVSPPASSELWTVGRQIVVTIGVDRYAEWPHLSNAVNDASEVSSAFRRLGFHDARSLVNEEATGAAIRKLVTDDLNRLGIDDSLVIFFAGHGATTDRVWADGAKIRTGYLVPSDAQAAGDNTSTWVPLDDWLATIARLPPKHILVIVDACHSGIALDALLRWRDVKTWQTDPTDELVRRRSRRIIVSAMDRELALDGGPLPGHSLFTGCLLQALGGGLPRDGRQAATGSELAAYVQRRVREFPSSRQTPDFGAFAHDDRGEMMIPLSPIAIGSVERASSREIDVHALLRQRLAATLGRLVSDRRAIACLVAAHLPTLAGTELPACDAATLWAFILVELNNRGGFTELSALIEAVQLRSRGARRVDWSAFAALLRPQPLPAVASWSQLGLELRCNSAAADRAVLITDGDALLEAITSVRWRGARPHEPAIEVQSYQLFGRSQPLLHQAMPQPCPGPGVASWLARIPVPHARIRTRRVSVRCIGSGLVERRYIVPRAGSVCASLVWLAFTAFAWIRLAPISPTLVTTAFLAFGVLSGLWSSIGVQLLRMSNEGRSYRSPFVAWELAVMTAAIAAAIVVGVPSYFIVTVANATLTPLSFQGPQSATIEPGMMKRIWVAALADWQPPKPLCRCDGNTDRCVCGKPVIVSPHGPLFGCLEGDCAHAIERIHQDSGSATLLRAPEAKAWPVTFAPGATSPEMQATSDDRDVAAVSVTNVVQTAGKPMQLDMVPTQKRYAIQFAHLGTLQCPAGANHVTRYPVMQPSLPPNLQLTTTGDGIEIAIGGTYSTWFGPAEEARACTVEPAAQEAPLTFRMSGDKLTCWGHELRQVVGLVWSSTGPQPPDTDGLRVRRLNIGDVRSTWTSFRSHLVRACAGTPGAIEIEGFAPGDRLTLPAELGARELAVRQSRAEAGSAVHVHCKPGGTLRAVKLPNVLSNLATITIGASRIERFAPRTGVTCDGSDSGVDHGQNCKLDNSDAVTCR